MSNVDLAPAAGSRRLESLSKQSSDHRGAKSTSIPGDTPDLISQRLRQVSRLRDLCLRLGSLTARPATSEGHDIPASQRDASV